MKRIVCEICDGMEFTKVDGMFECATCLTRYSAAETRKLLREIGPDGTVAASSAAPAEVTPTESTKAPAAEDAVEEAPAAEEIAEEIIEVGEPIAEAAVEEVTVAEEIAEEIIEVGEPIAEAAVEEIPAAGEDVEEISATEDAVEEAPAAEEIAEEIIEVGEPIAEAAVEEAPAAEETEEFFENKSSSLGETAEDFLNEMVAESYNEMSSGSWNDMAPVYLNELTSGSDEGDSEDDDELELKEIGGEDSSEEAFAGNKDFEELTELSESTEETIEEVEEEVEAEVEKAEEAIEEVEEAVEAEVEEAEEAAEAAEEAFEAEVEEAEEAAEAVEEAVEAEVEEAEKAAEAVEETGEAEVEKAEEVTKATESAEAPAAAEEPKKKAKAKKDPVRPSNPQVENIMMLAAMSFDTGSLAETENYCDQALSIDNEFYKSWFLKGRSICGQRTADTQRIAIAAYSLCKAVDVAPDDEKADIIGVSVNELAEMGLGLISVKKRGFVKRPGREELNGLLHAREEVLKSLTILLSRGGVDTVPEDYVAGITEIMDKAADEAFEMTNKTWAAIEHPGKDAFVNYIDWLSNIDTLLRQSIASGKGDGEMDVWRYEKLREVLQAPLDKCSWKKETKALTGNFRWVKDISLTEDAVTGRNNEIAKCDEIIASIRGGLTEQQAIKDKEEEEKSQAELEMYWENHPEERQLLEDELKSLFEEKENINTEINRINDELKEFNKEDSSKYDEKKKVVTKIRDLRVQLSKYGIFAGKEKRAIEEQLEKESKTLAEIEEAINLENKEKWENADKMIPELKQQKDDLRVQLADINKRIKEVNKSLSKGK